MTMIDSGASRRQSHRVAQYDPEFNGYVEAERIAAATACWSEAFFPGLQSSWRQAGPGRRHPARLRCDQGYETLGALQAGARQAAREGRPLIQRHYSNERGSVLTCGGRAGPVFCAAAPRVLLFLVRA